jgi:hypothetical protein
VLDHVQAVFKTIRAIVPETAWSHLLGRLPRDWPETLVPTPAPRHRCWVQGRRGSTARP